MATELTQDIGRYTTTITEDITETTFLFQRLSMALQRVNAVSFHNTRSPTEVLLQPFTLASLQYSRLQALCWWALTSSSAIAERLRCRVG